MIAHHLGGIIPYFEGRVGAQLGPAGRAHVGRGLRALLKKLKKRPFDYFKDFYGDTALAGARAPTVCGIDFFGADHVLFASDCPFDKEKGRGYIRATIEVMESLDAAAGRQGEDLPPQCGNHVRIEPALNEDSQVIPEHRPRRPCLAAPAERQQTAPVGR